MEYVILFSIIVAAMAVMYPRVKRTTQSLVKTAADQISDQAGAEQDFSDDAAYISNSISKTSVSKDNLQRDTQGVIQKDVNESTTTTTETLTNTGFSEL
jgi:Tfp pilus assembly protein PilV